MVYDDPKQNAYYIASCFRQYIGAEFMTLLNSIRNVFHPFHRVSELLLYRYAARDHDLDMETFFISVTGN